MPKYRPMPPLERLNELFEVVEIPPDKYGEWSGLIRKVGRRGGGKAGSVVGHRRRDATNPDRFDWAVTVDGITFYTSRVIYYMTKGEDPGNAQVDHEDQNWWNNNPQNLRLDVDGRIKQVNIPMYRNNTSGITGVGWDKMREKWEARVKVKDKLIHLGRYTCKIEAARVVRDKWIELGWDKLGRELPDLDNISCDCGTCKRIDLG
jgi:hypothetical protein